MQIIRNLGQNTSYHNKLNFLAKTGKIYIMDNHLAAFYCWSKEIDLSKDYALLHIDRHHDLGEALVKNSFQPYKKRDFKNMSLAKMLKLKTNGFQMMQWDNFIELFHAFHPLVIKHMDFIGEQKLPRKFSHCKLRKLKPWLKRELPIRELIDYSNPTNDGGRIVDLDIDVFFKEIKPGQYQEILTKKELQKFAERFEMMLKGADIVTIALSPECCGGWGNAIKMFDKLNAHLNILNGNLSV